MNKHPQNVKKWRLDINLMIQCWVCNTRFTSDTLHYYYFKMLVYCKAGRERSTPYQSHDPSPTTPTHRMKEENGKTAGEKK